MTGWHCSKFVKHKPADVVDGIGQIWSGDIRRMTARNIGITGGGWMIRRIHLHRLHVSVTILVLTSLGNRCRISRRRRSFLHRPNICVRLNDLVLLRNSFHSYGASLVIWDHTVLPATRHKWTYSALTPTIQAGTRFTYHSQFCQISSRSNFRWQSLGHYLPREQQQN